MKLVKINTMKTIKGQPYLVHACNETLLMMKNHMKKQLIPPLCPCVSLQELAEQPLDSDLVWDLTQRVSVLWQQHQGTHALIAHSLPQKEVPEGRRQGNNDRVFSMTEIRHSTREHSHCLDFGMPQWRNGGLLARGAPCKHEVLVAKSRRMFWEIVICTRPLFSLLLSRNTCVM